MVHRKQQSGFTLLEVLLVVGIITVLAAIVIVAINPSKQLGDSRNAQRRSDVNTILNAVYQYSIDNTGGLPGKDNANAATKIATTTKEICKEAVAEATCAGFAPQSPAGAPTVAIGAAGNVTGTYTYRVTFVTADGETAQGTASSVASPASQQVDISAIPTGGTGTTGRNVYRCDSTGANCLRMSSGTTIANNTATTLTDNTASYTGNPAPPTTHTNAGLVYLGDLTSSGKYIVKIPTDPGGSTNDSSKYSIVKDANNRITVAATVTDNSATISATK